MDTQALVAAVRDSVERGDRAVLRRVLHPYVRWTSAGTTTFGRTRVLALLAERRAAGEPVAVEVRNGQVYRWSEP